MEYKIRIEPLVYIQILDSLNFLKKVSLEAANKLHQEIMNGISSLKTMPYRFPVDERYSVAGQEERKMIISNGRYFVLYCIEGDTICVEYFYDSRQV